MDDSNINSIAKQINKFGRFQIFNFVLVCLLLISNCYFTLSYVFTAGDLNYRCIIDECDIQSANQTEISYGTDWLRAAIPYDEYRDKPLQCFKYDRVADTNINSSSSSSSNNNSSSSGQCDKNQFDRNTTIKCDRFVYEDEESTILRDYNLNCDENKWKLAMVGTLHNIGILMNLFLSGIISDTYGRRTVFIISAFLCGLTGLLQSFATTYWVFMIFKYLQALLGGGTYSSAVILVVELVPKQYRAAAGTMMLVCSSVGNLLLGVVAIFFRDWKQILQIGFLPSLISLFYFWLIPESMKWQLTKGRESDAAKTLLRITKSNNIEMTEQMTRLMSNNPREIIMGTSEVKEEEKPLESQAKGNSLREVLNYPAMMMRVVCCSFCWFANIIIFYGLSLISVVIGGDKYYNYIAVQISQIPACIFVMIVANKVGRKQLLCSSYLLSGAFLLIYTFAPDVQWVKLILYLMGKFCITVAFCTIYIYTSEMMPTSLRQTLLGVCSAFGRIGSALAPQVPLLELILPNLTMYMFGAVAVLAGIMALQFPETLNVDLPNTIQEALNLDRKSRRRKITNNNNEIE